MNAASPVATAARPIPALATACATLLTLLGLPIDAVAQTAAKPRPLALEGFNQDVIANGAYDGGAGSVQNSTSAPLDAEFNLYTVGFNPKFPATGLPADGVLVSAANPAVTFRLQPATGANALLLTDQASGVSGGTLSLATPDRFDSLAFLVTGLGSSTPVGYRLEFADGGKPTDGSFVAADNFAGKDPLALGGLGRVNRRTGQFDDASQAAGSPRLFEVDLPLSAADAARTLSAIAFDNLGPGPDAASVQSAERRVAIFAVSGFSAAGAVLRPLTVSGLTQDVIAEGGPTPPAGSTTAAIDGVHVFYAVGFNPAFPAVGLPAAGGTFPSAANPDVNFALAPPAGPNALLLSPPAGAAPTGTLTLAAPARFTALAALVTGLNGSNPGTYQLNFADAGPATAGSFTAPDSAAGTSEIALAGFGRVERATGAFDDKSQAVGNPRLFELSIPVSAADARRPLSGVTFESRSPGTGFMTAQPRNLAVFGLSGVFQAPPAGAVAFTEATLAVREDAAGGAVVSVTRAGGSEGPAQVNYSTRDNTARAGVDYALTRGALSWADGESGVKTFTVGIFNRPQAAGETAFIVDLATAPGSSAKIQTPAQAVVTIRDGATTADPVREVKLLSPPPGITVVQNQAVEIYVSVDAAIGGLAQTEFLVREDPAPVGAPGQSLGIATAARDVARWVPPGPGRFTLEALATGVNGQTRRQTRAITVAPAAATDAGPRVKLLGNLEGQQFAAGSPVTLVASAVDAAGAPLKSVQFYADGEPLGAPVVPVVRARPPAAPGSMRGPRPRIDPPTMTATAQLTAAIQRAVQLITAQGTDANGVSGVSEGAQVFTRAEEVASGLTCVIAAPAGGATLPVGIAGSMVNVLAADPGGIVQRVELFVDGLKVGERSAAPFSFALPALAAGPHVLTATATNGAELNRAAAPVNVEAAAASVSLSVSGDGTTREGMGKAKVIFTRTGGDLTTALPLTFKLKGTAVNGVDYKPLASTTQIVIPAGAATVALKIKPIDDATAKGTRTSVVQLKAPADGSYGIGAAKKATVQILDNE